MIYRFGDFRLALDQRALFRADGHEPIHLPPKAFFLLHYLLEKAPGTVSKDELASALWQDVMVTESSVTQAVRQARRALGEYERDARILLTMRGHGYRIGVPVETEARADVSNVVARTDRIPAGGPDVERRPRRRLLVGLAAAVVVLALAAWLARPTPLEIPEIAARAIPPRAPEAAIAVLPFADMSPGRDQAHFADGLSEEIIHSLAGLDRLRVVARTSAFRFRRDERDVREIARELDVGHVLEGSVRTGDGRLRVTAQLIDATSGMHVWSETFDRKAGDLLDVQASIARAVARELAVELVEVESAIAGSTPGDFRAHEWTLRGLAAFRLGAEESNAEAIRAYEKALEIDPEHARAWSGLALALGIRWAKWTNERRDGLLLQRMEDAARRAIELDPRSVDGHRALGGALQARHRDWEAADRAYRRALEIHPGSAGAHRGYAVYLMRTGQLGRAREHARRAVELDPLSADANVILGRLHLFAGEHEQALAYLHRAREVDPSEPISPGQLALAYRTMGRMDEAREAFLAWSPASVRPIARIAIRLLGSDRSLRWLFSYAEWRSGDPCGDRAAVASSVYATLGDTERMYECLARETERRHPWYIKVNPVFDPYRHEPRFVALLESVGLQKFGSRQTRLAPTPPEGM